MWKQNIVSGMDLDTEEYIQRIQKLNNIKDR